MKVTNFVLATFALVLIFKEMPSFGQSIPPELSALTDEALSYSCSGENLVRFDAIMAELGKKVDAKTCDRLLEFEGANLQAKVIVMAHYRTTHNELYGRIMDKYFNIHESDLRPGRHVGPLSPSVEKNPEFLTEEYRPIWEYYVLNNYRIAEKSVGNFSVKAGAGWNTIDALGKIGNEKSLILLNYVYQQTLLKSEIVFEESILDQLMQAICDIGGSGSSPQAALEVLLECFGKAEAYKDKFQKSYGKNLDDIFMGFLPSRREDELAKWRAAAVIFLKKSNLTAGQKSFLQKLTSATAKKPGE